MVFSPFSAIHLAADGRLFAELLGEHSSGLAAFEAKAQYRYVRSEVLWLSREVTAYRHTFRGPDGEHTVVTRHTRGVDDLGGLRALEQADRLAASRRPVSAKAARTAQRAFQRQAEHVQAGADEAHLAQYFTKVEAHPRRVAPSHPSAQALGALLDAPDEQSTHG